MLKIQSGFGGKFYSSSLVAKSNVGWPPIPDLVWPRKIFYFWPPRYHGRWGHFYFGLFIAFTLCLSHAFTCQFDSYGCMRDTVHNCVTHRGITYCLVPALHRILWGDDHGFSAMPVLNDFHQYRPFLGVETYKEEVIQYQQRTFLDFLKLSLQDILLFGHLKGTKKFCGICIKGLYSLFTSLITMAVARKLLPVPEDPVMNRSLPWFTKSRERILSIWFRSRLRGVT